MKLHAIAAQSLRNSLQQPSAAGAGAASASGGREVAHALLAGLLAAALLAVTDALRCQRCATGESKWSTTRERSVNGRSPGPAESAR